MFHELASYISQSSSRCSVGRDTRGQSYLLGTVLIIGITTAVATALFFTGFGFISANNAQADAQQASQSFKVLSEEVLSVAFGQSPSRTTQLGVGSPAEISTTDTGVFRVQVMNRSTGDVEETIAEERLGTVEYVVNVPTAGSRTVVYQGGGVWMQSDGEANSTSVESMPQVHYRGQTLTMPLIALNHSASKNNVGDSVTVRKEETRALFPVRSSNDSSDLNPVLDKEIRLSYEGEYYMAWSQVFEERLDGDVTVSHANSTSSIVLVTPDLEQQVNSGLQGGGSATDSIFIRGSGGSPSFVDSYNSSEGTYSSSSTSEGVVRSGGDITLRGDATIRGDAVVPDGYIVDVGGGSEVTGDVRNEPVTGAAVDSSVRSRCSAFESSNDNGDTTAIDGASLNGSQSSWTLESGTYYLDGDLDVGAGESLVFDNSGGPINLCVNRDVVVSGGSVSVVDGSGSRVNVYQQGYDFSVTNGGVVSVPNDVSTTLWFYGLQRTNVLVKDSRVVGVVYMPAGDDGDGSAVVQTDGEVFGAVVSGPIEMKSGGRVHYDQALEGADATGGLDSLPVVSYLHVSVTEVVFDE